MKRILAVIFIALTLISIMVIPSMAYNEVNVTTNDLYYMTSGGKLLFQLPNYFSFSISKDTLPDKYKNMNNYQLAGLMNDTILANFRSFSIIYAYGIQETFIKGKTYYAEGQNGFFTLKTWECEYDETKNAFYINFCIAEGNNLVYSNDEIPEIAGNGWPEGTPIPIMFYVDNTAIVQPGNGGTFEQQQPDKQELASWIVHYSAFSFPFYEMKNDYNYQQGYADGMKTKNEQYIDIGYEEGKLTGYSEGYNQGVLDAEAGEYTPFKSLINTVVLTPIKTVTDYILDFEVFGLNMGIFLKTIIGVLAVISVIFFLVRFL